MTCRELTETLTDYLDGRLPVLTRWSTWLHLSLCRDCRRYLAGFRETVRLAREAGREPEAPADPPEDLVRAILKARGEPPKG
jgi:anti-sigma factor RsiW